jgi:hypothetical protein
MEFTIAYLAGGKLRVKAGEEPPRTIESQYGQTIRDRAVKAAQRHAWKAQGTGDKFLSGEMLWGRAVRDPGAVRVDITSICGGQPGGQILYSLESDSLCGILAVEGFGVEERRLWNNHAQRLRYLSHHPVQGHLACSLENRFGTANIAVVLGDGSGLREVTEGDSVDTAPRWIPGDSLRLVFQSAGVGRDRDGHFAALAPYAIQELDVDNGDLTTLAEDPQHDLLTPQKTADGALFYIRRPHRAPHHVSIGRFSKDILLFPFRLLYAIVQYLNFFSAIYTGKKLTSVGSARTKQQLDQMMIWGNLVHAAKTEPDGDGAPDLVPKSWQLVRVRSGGDPETLAKGVLAYDIAPDGSVIFSNGSAIYRLDSNGRQDRLLKDRLIEQVAVLKASSQPA